MLSEDQDTSSNEQHHDLLCNLLNYQAADLSLEINRDIRNCKIFSVFVVSPDLGNSGNLLVFPYISTPDLILHGVRPLVHLQISFRLTLFHILSHFIQRVFKKTRDVRMIVNCLVSL